MENYSGSSEAVPKRTREQCRVTQENRTSVHSKTNSTTEESRDSTSTWRPMSRYSRLPLSSRGTGWPSFDKSDLFGARQRDWAKTIAEALITVRRQSPEEAIGWTDALPREISLLDKAECYHAARSAGQQKRIGIGRAIMPDADPMLFDEPTPPFVPEWFGDVLDAMRRRSPLDYADRGS